MITLSVIKADIGGYVGHSSMHPEILAHGSEALARAVQGGLLIDGQAQACGDDLFLIMSHDRGQDDEAVHRLAWDTFSVGTEIAKRLGLYGAGQDLLTDAFSGTVRGSGPGSAEVELVERPSEPVIVFMAGTRMPGAVARNRLIAPPVAAQPATELAITPVTRPSTGSSKTLPSSRA